MALRLKDKQTIVAEVGSLAKNALSIVTAEYEGLSVEEMTQLRRQARDAGVYLRVVRNTLARRALEGTGFECLQDTLVGPLLLALSPQEPSAAAHLIRSFIAHNEKLKVKALAFDGRLFSANEIDKLADLPTRDKALATLMAVMQAPVIKLIRTMSEPSVKLLRTLLVLSNQKK